MRISFQSLKFKIAANFAVIILLSVLLSDVVIVHITQKSLIRDYIHQGQQYLSLFPDSLKEFYDDQGLLNAVMDRQRELPGIFRFFILLKNGTILPSLPADAALNRYISKHFEQLRHSKIVSVQFYGKTFGVFWHQRKYIFISAPLTNPDHHIAGMKVAVIELDSLYKALRQAQKIVVLYILANFILLVSFGVYRMSRLIIRPIHRFIKMTDDFRAKDRFYFSYGKNHQEFNQLSKALNHMVDTIETDKKNLKHSLDELEHANKQLKTAQQEIIKAEKLASVGRLSAGIAHEIGNPIGIVLGYLDLLKLRPALKTDETGQDFLKRAQDEINRINRVIRQLLDFSRSTPENVDAVTMHDLISETIKILADQPFMSGITIQSKLAATSDTVVLDREQIRQVLINLIINAADAIKANSQTEAGLITIETEFVPGHHDLAIDSQPTFSLKITDNGAGIDQSDIDYVFDPFFTTKEPGKGTGLGLWVSYMIIDKARGRISVESKQGKGTMVGILLPLFLLE